MEYVTLYPVMHRGTEQILIQCKNLKELNAIIRRVKGVKWSQTHKSWYLQLSRENYDAIREALHGVAVINPDELKKYLLKKKLSAR